MVSVTEGPSMTLDVSAKDWESITGRNDTDCGGGGKIGWEERSKTQDGIYGIDNDGRTSEKEEEEGKGISRGMILLLVTLRVGMTLQL